MSIGRASVDGLEWADHRTTSFEIGRRTSDYKQIVGQFQRVGRLKKSSIDANPTSDRCATDFAHPTSIVFRSLKNVTATPEQIEHRPILNGHRRRTQSAMSAEDLPICDSGINICWLVGCIGVLRPFDTF